MLTKLTKNVILLSSFLLLTGCGASQPATNTNQVQTVPSATVNSNADVSVPEAVPLDINKQLDNRVPEEEQQRSTSTF